MDKLILATRKSKLAQVQTEIVMDSLKTRLIKRVKSFL